MFLEHVPSIIQHAPLCSFLTYMFLQSIYHFLKVLISLGRGCFELLLNCSPHFICLHFYRQSCFFHTFQLEQSKLIYFKVKHSSAIRISQFQALKCVQIWNNTNTHDLSHVNNCISTDKTLRIIKCKSPLSPRINHNGVENILLHTF